MSLSRTYPIFQDRFDPGKGPKDGVVPQCRDPRRPDGTGPPMGEKGRERVEGPVQERTLLLTDPDFILTNVTDMLRITDKMGWGSPRKCFEMIYTHRMLK